MCSKEVKRIEEIAILGALLSTFTGNNMLGRLTIKSANSWLSCKISKARTQAIEALYKNGRLFHNGHKVLGNTTAVVTKATFNNFRL